MNMFASIAAANISRVWFLLGCFLVLATSVGCSDGRPQRVPVSGKVLLNGQPLARGFVSFVTSGGRPAVGKIQPDGTFKLTTFDPDDGCLVGDFRVAVKAFQAEGNNVRWFVPPEYGDDQTSPLTVRVDSPRDDVVLAIDAPNFKPVLIRGSSTTEGG